MGSVERVLTPDAVKIVLVLFLSFLVGLEREEHKTAGVKYVFGGVRTFPLIGLVGLRHGLPVGRAGAAGGDRHGRRSRLPVDLLLAQAPDDGDGRRHLRDLGTRHLPGRRARGARCAVGGDRAERVRRLPAGAQVGARGTVEADRRRGDPHLHDLPPADGRRPAGAAEPGVRALPDQPVPRLARRRGRQLGVLRQLRHPARDARARRSGPRGDL